MPDAHATFEVVGDEALARRIADGQPGSTDAEEAELYRRFAPRVRLYGRRHLQNDAAADDLAQDVLLLTIERLRAGEVRRPAEIGSFILGTSRMMAQAGRRVARRREALVARFMDTSAQITSSSIAALDTPRVAACLRTLAERDRLVVLLTFYADREAPRIAEDLGVSPGAVRAIRHRAMARLRECVLGQGTVLSRSDRQDKERR
jgi:RNA polymerase sigma-70 factor (ECF subfamily)